MKRLRMMGKRNRVLWILLLAAEVIALVLLFFARYQDREETHFTADQLQSEEGSQQISSPAVTMDPGIYSVHLHYATDNGDNPAWSKAVSLNQSDRYLSVDSDKITLYGDRRNVTYRVYVRSNDNQVSIQSGYDDSDDYLIIDQMDIVYLNGKSAASACLFLLFVFALLDTAVVLLCKKSLHRLSPEKRRIVLGLAGVIFLINLPLYVKYIPDGHDIQFHLLRIYGIAEGLAAGEFPVRIMMPWINGYGYATGVCYGDILLYFPAVLYDLGFPLMWAYKSLVFLTNAAVALVSYFCFRKIGNSRNIGLFASAVYTLGLWHIVDVYTRAAVGEADALIFLPLVLLGLWYLTGQEADDAVSPVSSNVIDSGNSHKNGSHTAWKTVLYLSIGFSGLLETHLLSLIMMALFTVIILLCAWKNVFHRKAILTLLASAGMTVLLCMGFLIPFLDYYLTFPMQISTKPAETIQYQAGTLAELFLTTYQTTGIAKDGHSITGSILFSPGLTVLAALGIAVYGCIMDKWKKYRRLLATGSVVMIFAVLLSTIYMPYDWIMVHMPVLYKLFGSMQFPWRFFTIVTLLGTALAVLIARELRESGMRKQLLLFAAILGACSVIQGTDYMSDFIVQQAGMVTAYDGASLMDFRNTAEYLPEGSTLDPFHKLDIITSDAGLTAGEPSRVGKNYIIPVSNTTAANQTASVTLLMYKGYHAWDDSGNELKLQADTANNNRIMVTIPAGYSGNVTIRFVEPWYWRAGEIASVIIFMLLAVIIFRRYHVERYCNRRGMC
jgi:hypothetical protein